MRKIMFSSFVFLYILSGCNNNAYQNAIQKGLDYIASEDYKKAEAAFELALEGEKDASGATALLTQLRNYLEALDALELADLELATEKAEEVSRLTDGSSALIHKAEELLLSIEDLLTKQSALTENYDLAMQYFEEGKYPEAQETIDTVLNSDLDHLLFHPLKNDADMLQHNIEIALLEKEKIEVELEAEIAVEDEQVEIEPTNKELVEGKEEEKEKVETEKLEETATRSANKGLVNLTPEDAFQAIKNDRDWPPSTIFELEPDVLAFDGKPYYGIYVESPTAPGRTDLYLIDPTDGSVYNYDQGDLQRPYIKVK
ncbi:hypothetical protein KGF86_01030 [Ornithinibacillus massiliensis]|uniref:Uncharacterized protein n=1 Tax=Ornithinibacillus massiliensis TaxID=1944633 RepID=A0ABS5M8Z6_9BACI|nr:hypothetical protein [Ornithinibacillus massiliensis]MBS3678789.1 hypothetical protein [Ornithinibacillus massiliensis]